MPTDTKSIRKSRKKRTKKSLKQSVIDKKGPVTEAKQADLAPEKQEKAPVSAEIKAKPTRKWRNSPCPKCGEAPCVTEQASRYKATLRCRACKHRFEVSR